MKKSIRQIQNTPGSLEALIWLIALVLLALWQPGSDAHLTLCPLSAVGFEHCPGCGLGRSISHLFHGHIQESVKMHWLGIPATAILSTRIISVFRRIINQKQNES